MKWLWLTLLVFCVCPATARAAEAYFEFNPDYAESLLVASSDTVLEVFLPLNEHMSGMDFWVSNAAAAGDITFTLFNQAENQLAQRTVPLGAIADSPSGTRVHVGWPGQLLTSAATPYHVRITTAVPTVRLYYAGTNPILAHNASPAISYSSGRANIGGEEKQFSFKFALYENTETLPPTLANVQVSQPAVGQAIISFNANEPVDAQVQHTSGSVAYTGQYTSCVTGIATCSVTLAVTPGIEHTYTLTALDSWGNETVQTGSFDAVGSAPSNTPVSSPTPTSNSTPGPDTTAPVITNLRAANITTTGATIAWTTDEAANSLVVVQSLPFLISAGGGSDNTQELEHAITIGNIGSDTRYLARVTSSDMSGNNMVATVSFQTLAVNPTPPASTPNPSATPSATPSVNPNPSSPTPTPTVSVGPSGNGGQTAQWNPPANGDPANGYRIDIVGADGKLIRTIRTKDTSTALGDVPDGATILVYADNDGVYEKVAPAATVSRPSFFERLITLLPYILIGLVVAIGATVGIIKLRQSRRPVPPTGPPPPLTGAQPNPSAF